MALSDILNQDEIDALLSSTEIRNDIDTDPCSELGSVREYDFVTHGRIVRGHMPTLNLINERMANELQSSLLELVRQEIGISVQDIKILKFGEYIHSLYMPTSINILNFPPLKGKGLINFEAKLIFLIVDSLFGGNGQLNFHLDGHEFSDTECRIIRLLCDLICVDLVKAWEPVLRIETEHLMAEDNPSMVTIVDENDVVIVNTFRVEFANGGGDLHVMLPYSMVEPIRKLLDSKTAGESNEQDAKWTESIQKEMMDAMVNVQSTLCGKQVSLREILEYKKGDIIPIEIPELITLCAASVPVFECRYGTSNDHLALKIENRFSKK